jgi:hypothetical protein
LERVLSVLKELRKDKNLAGRVEDALDDINIFVPKQHP